ncbi:MAG: ribosomal protein S18-alanine N-acetyltransferase [Planctomycetaceae bacterium]|jgi:ribosomal-protein-alanine N-acetyltransferase|nr:ribosomal protein S18-alanine N-acetyltransferase [Planctomycetaceae bacterium]
MEYPLVMQDTTVVCPNVNRLTAHIRWMVRRDISEVIAVERKCFEFPWSEDDFLYCLRRRNSLGMVAEYGNVIVGFMIYEIPKDKIHLLNLAVAPKLQRCGIGTAMVTKLANKLVTQNRSRVYLEVRECNLNAQLFFRSQGFLATKILKNYYDKTDEDAYVMQYQRQQQHADTDRQVVTANVDSLIGSRASRPQLG